MPLSCENPQIATRSEKEQKLASNTYMKEKLLLLEDEGHRLLTILPLEGQRAGEHFKLGGKEKKGRSHLSKSEGCTDPTAPSSGSSPKLAKSLQGIKSLALEKIADIVFSQKELGPQGLQWERVQASACSCRSPRIQQPPDGGTRSAQTLTSRRWGGHGHPHAPHAAHPSTHWDNGLRSSASPEKHALLAGCLESLLQSPFGERGEQPQVSTSARRAESCKGVSELPLEQLLGQVPKHASWVHTINTPYDHQSALWEWPWRFTTSGAIYSTVPQKE